ncbi:MAG: hypothetical protein CMJ23_00635 [Phycisphaerae bacterium]|nr:hypothetical protein [Phycisphaerae bacterium]
MTESRPHAVRLAFSEDADLEDERLKETVLAAANGIAERTGVALQRVEIMDRRLEIAVEGPPMLAIGLAAELRRTTDRWHLDRRGLHLWVAPDPDADPDGSIDS